MHHCTTCFQVLFVSERTVIGVGFDCNPMVFAADERGIWYVKIKIFVFLRLGPYLNVPSNGAGPTCIHSLYLKQTQAFCLEMILLWILLPGGREVSAL